MDFSAAMHCVLIVTFRGISLAPPLSFSLLLTLYRTSRRLLERLEQPPPLLALHRQIARDQNQNGFLHPHCTPSRPHHQHPSCYDWELKFTYSSYF